MIRCKLCGKELEVINYLHLRTHGLTLDEYKRMFPDAELSSKEFGKKISEALTGRKRPDQSEFMKKVMQDPDRRRKSSEILRKLHAEGKVYKFPYGNANPAKRPEVRKKISEKKKKQNPSGFKPGNENIAKRPDVRKKISNALRKRIKITCVECGGEFETIPSVPKRFCSVVCRNRYLARRSKEKRSRRMKELWKERGKEWIKSIWRGLERKPTNPERMLMNIIKKYNLPYKYVGDGEFWVGNPPMNPDFININGKKVVIEVLGDYWHTPEEFEKRKRRFAEYGFKCIGIWEHELNELSEEEIVKRLTG